MRIIFRDDLPAPVVIDFLRGPRLFVTAADYPDYHDWLQRIEPELARGTKRHLACIWNREMAGIIVWQRHKTSSYLLELKNLTVRPETSGRLVGSFLLRQAEIEGHREYGAFAAVCDAKQSNRAVLSFLSRAGYKPQMIDNLYRLGSSPDVVMHRTLASANVLEAPVKGAPAIQPRRERQRPEQ